MSIEITNILTGMSVWRLSMGFFVHSSIFPSQKINYQLSRSIWSKLKCFLPLFATYFEIFGLKIWNFSTWTNYFDKKINVLLYLLYIQAKIPLNQRNKETMTHSLPLALYIGHPFEYYWATNGFRLCIVHPRPLYSVKCLFFQKVVAQVKSATMPLSVRLKI